jgi:hypothetical protein
MLMPRLARFDWLQPEKIGNFARRRETDWHLSKPSPNALDVSFGK